MKKQKIAIVTMFALFFFSCTQDNDQADNNIIPNNNYENIIGEEKVQEIEVGDDNINDIIHFSYKGKKYSSKCSFGEELKIEDENVKAIFNTLNNTPNIAIAINPNHSIEFYDSIEEVEKMNKNLAEARAATNIPYIQNFELRIWEHAKGRKKGGRFNHFYSNGLQGNQTPPPLNISQTDLNRLNFNNCISSIQMWGHLGYQLGTRLNSGQYQTASVTFYDGNFTGKSLTFNDITVNKTYSERDYFSSFDFNDLTSSITIMYF